MPRQRTRNNPASSAPERSDPLQEVEVQYEHSTGLAKLLHQLNTSIVLTTYQAGRVVTIGTAEDGIKIGFTYLPQAMGLTRTPTGIAIGTQQGVWSFPASIDLAAELAPAGLHDVAFLARSFHQTGPVMGHDLAWCDNRLWLVNTLFNCLCTLEVPWSFVPQWRPPFISAMTPEDRCHLNGLATRCDGSGPAFVTAHSSSDKPGGWRERKADGGCLVNVNSGGKVLEGLCMPHSPRIHQDNLYLLNSGHGTVLHCSPDTGTSQTICTLPGFTRGMDCLGDIAVIGLSRIRESAVFGGLPITCQHEQLRCGIVIIELRSGRTIGHIWFSSGVEEIYSVCFIPGYQTPAILGPDPIADQSQSVWLVPSSSTGHRDHTKTTTTMK